MIQPIAIEKYCDALKDRIIFDHFNRDLHITGESIKNLTPVPQINHLVIRKIFEKWQKETEKLKSPFFDYEHEDVKNALQDFMKKLSFHIKINKDYFEIILKEALHESFDYLENPVVFLLDEIFTFKGKTISYTEIQARAKYLKLYTKEINSFLQNTKITQSEIRLDVLTKIIEEEFAHINKLEEEKAFVEQISKIVPNNFINLVETKPAVEKTEHKKNFIDDLEFEGLDFPTDKEEIEPIEVEEEIDEQIIESTPEKEEVKTSKASIKTGFTGLDVNKTNQLAPIDHFDDGISLQQKFYFLRELFDNQETAFIQAVRIADTKTSFDEACTYLWDTYSDLFDWSNKEEAIAEFLSILNRKF